MNIVTYRNPVWPDYFADPFVLKWRGSYYAYGTGGAEGELRRQNRVFQVLQSDDLVHWRSLGGAMPVEPGARHSAYWAPEVIERDGRFYLYFSSAFGESDETHRLRVAVADHPAGPFLGDGRELLPDQKFTIDAHPFHDLASDRWYLFFARDYFDHRAGTALAAVPLAGDMVSAAGPVADILRASADWQIYQRDRFIYERVWPAWHTLEGPTVTVRDGRYILLYSGGNWQTDSYGVGYAVADSPEGPYVEPESGPAVLRGDGERVIGPGHNCVILGPDERTQFIVYHAWNAGRTARLMCIDPLVWTPDGRPRCAGPSTDAQQVTIVDEAAA